MPYKIKKCDECGCGTYKVINTKTGQVKAKHTTLKKAQAQVRLLKGKEKVIEPPSVRQLRDRPTYPDGVPLGFELKCSHQPLRY